MLAIHIKLAYLTMEMPMMDMLWKMTNLKEKLLAIHIEWVYLIKPLAIHLLRLQYGTTSDGTHHPHTK